MSGTSADGIDAAVIRVVGTGRQMRVRYWGHFHVSYPRRLRDRLLAVMTPAATSTEAIARLHAELGDRFAEAAAEMIRTLGPRRRLAVIGLAGQTVCHLPGRRGGPTVTLQLGDPARVAWRTGVPTVADFRQADVAAGGQGAPLVPWTDWILFRDPRQGRLVQNIGGIANLTVIPAGSPPEGVDAFDTGPGNMLIDEIVSRLSHGREAFDRDGRWARRGRILPDLLERWLAHPYFDREPPKTTGREEFGRPFLDRHGAPFRGAGFRREDLVATATMLTARSIARACRSFIGSQIVPDVAGQGRASPRLGRARQAGFREMIVCGGGARNPVLMSFLARELPGVRILPIDRFGMPAEAKEAVSFALLGLARLDGEPANLPRVTDASQPVIMGQLTPAARARHCGVGSRGGVGGRSG